MSDTLERIIASKRLPVLFIGSGLSKRYLNDFPSWEQLLEKLRGIIGLSKSSYAATSHKFKSAEPNISNGKLNQKMASYLQEKFLEKIENDQIDISTIFTDEENEKCIDEGIDYFKMLVAKIFSTYEINSEQSEELSILRKISDKVSMVFTTNYDLFLQTEIFPNFKVYESQNKYYFRTNNEYGELYKIHGCVNDPNGIILCENDYQKFESSLKLVSSKLINALMDFPIIFLGYSLEDENIKKIMADFVSSFDDVILQDIKRYMILVIYEEGQNELIEGEKQFADNSTGKNITLTTIKTDNFKKLYEYIDRLTPSATTYELRRYKTMVADLISKSAKGDKKVFVQEIDEAKADAMALYIGSKNAIEGIQKSVNIYSNADIIKKALYDEEFEYNEFATLWYNSKGIAGTQYTPVFLIRNKMSVTYESCCDKFKKNYESRKQFFDNLNLKEIFCNIEDIKQKYEKLKNSGRGCGSICSSICKELENMLYFDNASTEQCLDFLKRIFEEYPNAVDESPFKRLACYVWYKKYEK